MTQQTLFGDSGDKYKKKLFVDNGLSFEEVKARIIEPYGSPVPQPNIKEVKLINAPSHIQAMGLSSYRMTVVLLFVDKLAYSEYMTYVGFGHKYYDERGSIYMGSVESVKSTPVEANRRYKVEIGLVLIKKDLYDYERREPQEFQDILGYDDEPINNLARLGVISTYYEDGSPSLYFYPGSPCSRAEFAAFLMRTKRLIEKMLRE